MQPDGKAGQAFGPGHRIGGFGCGHHQAGGGENSILVGGLDRLVNGKRETEIVAGDNQAFQTVFSRPHRKRKNSTPSRSCRFITCQSLHMS